MRCQGIGRRLIEMAEEFAYERGCTRVRVSTTYAVSFYERLGFRILNEHELTPGLAARVREEEMGGLSRELRVVMRRELPV